MEYDFNTGTLIRVATRKARKAMDSAFIMELLELTEDPARTIAAIDF